METNPNSGRIDAEIEKDVALQTMIDTLLEDGPDHSVEDNEERVRAALAKDDLPAMPDPWVQAVAQSLAWGNAYVVSEQAQERVDIPEPSNSPKNVEIT